VTLMNVATQRHAAEWSSRAEPSRVLMLTGVILLSVISIVAVGALHQPGPDAPKFVYLTASLAAICCGVPWASMRPWSSTQTRSARWNTTRMSCSISTME